MSMIYQAFCWASSYINFYLYNKTTRLIFYFYFAIEKTDTQRIKWFSLGHSGVAEIWSHVHVIPQSLLTQLHNLALSIYSFEYFFLGKRLWENLFTVSQPSKLHHDLQHLLSFRVHKPFSQSGNQCWPGNVAPFKKLGIPYLLTYFGFQLFYYYVCSTISNFDNLEWGGQSILRGWIFLLSFQSCCIPNQWFFSHHNWIKCYEQHWLLSSRTGTSDSLTHQPCSLFGNTLDMICSFQGTRFFFQNF